MYFIKHNFKREKMILALNLNINNEVIKYIVDLKLNQYLLSDVLDSYILEKIVHPIKCIELICTDAMVVLSLADTQYVLEDTPEYNIIEYVFHVSKRIDRIHENKEEEYSNRVKQVIKEQQRRVEEYDKRTNIMIQQAEYISKMHEQQTFLEEQLCILEIELIRIQDKLETNPTESLKKRLSTTKETIEKIVYEISLIKDNL